MKEIGVREIPNYLNELISDPRSFLFGQQICSIEQSGQIVFQLGAVGF